jgi:hypothetical protein
MAPYSNVRKNRLQNTIVDMKKQEKNWRTQSLATLPELGNGLETPPQLAERATRKEKFNKSMVVVLNDEDALADDDNIERAAEDASHNRYI